MQRCSGGGPWIDDVFIHHNTEVKINALSDAPTNDVFFLFSFLVMLPQPHGHVTLPYSTSEPEVVFKAARLPASDTGHGYHDMDVIKDKMMWLSAATQRSITQYDSFSSPLLK